MASPFARLSPKALLVALVFWEAGARPGELWSKDISTLLALTDLSQEDFIRALVELRLAACLWYSFSDRECCILQIRLARASNETNERIVRQDIYKNETDETTNETYTSTSSNEESESFAGELASRLDEPQRVEYYRRLIARYPESQIRRALTECMATPTAQIRKNRAALFHYLLKLYEN